ncbi:MAG: cold shock domain-containing protein [Bacteroidales bacterium]|nr:cold shock domain-containing protein [Bacteroidales bacterium]
METGTIKFFNHKKGYGFIVDDNTSKDVFVHFSDLIEQVDNDDKVIFDVQKDERGIKAINVKKAGHLEN